MGNFLSHVKNKKRNKKKKPIKIATFVTKATLLFFEQSLSNFFRNCGKLVESSKLYTCAICARDPFILTPHFSSATCNYSES